MDGKMTRTIGMYGTQAMADEAGMSLEEYREQIIKACYLDKDDPIATWQQTMDQINHIKSKLTSLGIQKVHIQ
jgi:aminopeptidase